MSKSRKMSQRKKRYTLGIIFIFLAVLGFINLTSFSFQEKPLLPYTMHDLCYTMVRPLIALGTFFASIFSYLDIIGISLLFLVSIGISYKLMPLRHKKTRYIGILFVLLSLYFLIGTMGEILQWKGIIPAYQLQGKDWLLLLNYPFHWLNYGFSMFFGIMVYLFTPLVCIIGILLFFGNTIQNRNRILMFLWGFGTLMLFSLTISSIVPSLRNSLLIRYFLSFMPSIPLFVFLLTGALVSVFFLMLKVTGLSPSSQRRCYRSGKSVFLNILLYGLLVSKHSPIIRFVLADPKQIEMVPYQKLPHLACPVITENRNLLITLEALCGIMNERYALLSQKGEGIFKSASTEGPIRMQCPYISLKDIKVLVDAALAATEKSASTLQTH